MSRQINKLFVYDTANFAGLTSFNSQPSSNSVNFVLNTGSNQIGIGSGVQPVARNVYLPDSITTSNATFVLVDQPQTLTFKTLSGATITGSSFSGVTISGSSFSNVTISNSYIVSPFVTGGTFNNSYLFAPVISNATISTSYQSNSYITGATISSANLINPIMNEILDTNGNLALLISPAASTNNTTWQALTVGGSASNTVVLGTTGASANINITVAPKGTGQVKLRSLSFPTGVGSAGQVLAVDGAGNVVFQLSDQPSSFTVTTTSSVTTVTKTIGSPVNNEAMYITVQGAAISTATNNPAATFDLRTSWKRITSSPLKIQSPILTDDILSARDVSSWNVSTSTDGTNVQLVVVGDLTATVEWQFMYQAVTWTFV